MLKHCLPNDGSRPTSRLQEGSWLVTHVLELPSAAPYPTTLTSPGQQIALWGAGSGWQHQQHGGSTFGHRWDRERMLTVCLLLPGSCSDFPWAMGSSAENWSQARAAAAWAEAAGPASRSVTSLFMPQKNSRMLSRSKQQCGEQDIGGGGGWQE